MAKPKLNDSDSKLLETLLAEYATIDNDKLAPVQRVIINLNSIDQKTSDDYKSLRAMLKIERDRLSNAKLIADTLAKQEKAKSDAQVNFTHEFFNAIENKTVIYGLSSSMTAKQLLQKLFDEKIVSSNSALKQFLNSVIDDVAPVEQKEEIAPAVASSEVAQVVSVENADIVLLDD